MPLFKVVLEVTPVEQSNSIDEVVGMITAIRHELMIEAPNIEAAACYSKYLLQNESRRAVNGPSSPNEQLDPILDKKLKDFGVFCVRTLNALKFNNIVTLGDLVNYSRRDLLELRGIGRWSLNEILKLFTDLSNNDKSFDLKLKP